MESDKKLEETIQLEVEFLTFGDAAIHLDVNPSTLRHWSNSLEQIGVHFLERVNGDRVFYPEDLKIFAFIKEMREKYGRKTTIEKLAAIIAEKFNCRNLQQRPDLVIYQKSPEIVNFEIEQLIHHEQFQKLLEAMVNKAAQNILPSDIIDQLKDNMRKELESQKAEMKKEIERIENERSKKLDQLMTETLEIKRLQSLPGWKRFLGIGLKKK